MEIGVQDHHQELQRMHKSIELDRNKLALESELRKKEKEVYRENLSYVQGLHLFLLGC